MIVRPGESAEPPLSGNPWPGEDQSHFPGRGPARQNDGLPRPASNT
jgi:hypothetical protein